MRLHEDSQAFSDLIEETAQAIELPEIYIEKDYWLTKSLLQLSNSTYIDKVIFKGGTSLSKAYKLIKRFSEDIDLAVLASELGDSARKKLLKSIEASVSAGLKYLPKDERESKGSKFRKTVYQYPRIINSNDFGQASPELLIELNSFTNPELYESRELRSLIAEFLIEKNRSDLIELFNLESFSVNVLSVKRTLVEKILRVIKDSHNDDPIKALSKNIRHLFDIHSILCHDKYHGFIASDEFKQIIDKCIADEKVGDFVDTKFLTLNLADAPLFSKFNEWRPQLEQIYKNDFADLVCGELDPIENIQDSLMLLKEKLK